MYNSTGVRDALQEWDNGYTDTMEKMLKRLEYDLYYLGNRSWFFDFKILAKTFLSIVFGKKF